MAFARMRFTRVRTRSQPLISATAHRLIAQATDKGQASEMHQPSHRLLAYQPPAAKARMVAHSQHGCYGVVVGRHKEARDEQGRAADEDCKGNRSPGRITTHGNCPVPQASARIMAESLEGVKNGSGAFC